MANWGSVREAMADALPFGVDFLFYHLSTPPTPFVPLFSAAPGRVEEKTLCESHFLAASLPPNHATDKELLVFAIEVLVFTTHELTTIFVSKADSTGFLHLFKLQSIAPSILRTICATFLSFLIPQYLPSGRVLLSLFARSQNQYLFPGSIENPGKHVLDDRQLIKWWCRVLDPILRQYAPPASASPDALARSRTTSEAHIIVPGCDKADTRAFFPPGAKTEQRCRWSNGYPLQLIVPDVSAPPRCLIPRFPDDPKARFLNDLDSEISEEGSTRSGRWRSVQSLDEFWEMMSYRQECSAGRVVGFLWLVFTPDQHSSCLNGAHANVAVSAQSSKSNQSQHKVQPEQLSDPVRASALPPHLSPSPPPESIPDHNMHNKHPKLPLTDDRPLERTEPAQSTMTCTIDPFDPSSTDTSQPIRWPTASRGHLITDLAYQSLMTHLLQHSDFSTQALAASSTASWIAKAFSLLAKSSSTTESSEIGAADAREEWGAFITGRNVASDLTTAMTTTEADRATTEPDGNGSKPAKTSQVNILTGLRKKRKIIQEDEQIRSSLADVIKQQPGIAAPYSATTAQPNANESDVNTTTSADQNPSTSKRLKTADRDVTAE